MENSAQQQQKAVKLVIDQVPGLILLKDMHLVYVAGNTNTAEAAGFKHADELVGINDYDMKSKVVNCADLFIMRDKKVLSTGDTCTFFDIVPGEDGQFRAFIDTKSIFKDSEGNKSGVLMNAIEVPRDLLIKVCVYLSHHGAARTSNKHNRCVSPANYLLSDHYEGLSLTKRQSECFFYLLRGLSCKSIAKVLGLSPRTVEGYVEAIKSKMGCHSKQALIEQSIACGYVDIIPNTVFDSILLSMMN